MPTKHTRQSTSVATTKIDAGSPRAAEITRFLDRVRERSPRVGHDLPQARSPEEGSEANHRPQPSGR